jgi:hypothetical protein
MQPTNVGDTGRRPRPSFRPTARDHTFSQGRLQLISHSLGRPTII